MLLPPLREGGIHPPPLLGIKDVLSLCLVSLFHRPPEGANQGTPLRGATHIFTTLLCLAVEVPRVLRGDSGANKEIVTSE